jgi:exonuclease III
MGFHLENVTTIPSGRAVETVYQEIHFINIYVPPRTAMRKDREQFFNVDLPLLFHTDLQHMILGGDFNCALHPADASVHFHPSRALAELARGFALRDTWK